MKGIIVTSGMVNWRLVYLEELNKEEKIAILNEFGYGVEEKDNLYRAFFLDDNESISSNLFESVDKVFYHIDAEMWFEDDNIAIMDIPGETLKYDNVELEYVSIPSRDSEGERVTIHEYNLSEMSDAHKIALIREVDFEVFKQCNGKYRLIDLQGGNLAGIEYQRFSAIDSIIDRLDNYWNDFFIDFREDN